MQRVTRCFFRIVLVSVLMVALASCDNGLETDDAASAGSALPVDAMLLGIDFSVPLDASGGGYEEGTGYENYIDIPNGNYRIYLFDADNKFIARFAPAGFIINEGSDGRRYSVLGKAPEELASCEAFKVVVLANWPQYDDAAMTPGVTTISDIRDADWAQFDCLTDFKLSADRLMPFYGVHEYGGVTFTSGLATVLGEPVTLLRAMAKVEVILETDSESGLSFSEVKLNRYNAKGYCAPSGVFAQGDYDHNGSWSDDYVKSLHLVGGVNDTDDKEDLSFRRVNRWSEGRRVYEKWIAYLPEYQNAGAGDLYSSIRTRLSLQLADDSPNVIYFAEYSDGKTENVDDARRLDIERNNIYRFRVQCTGYQFKLLLSVSDWESLHENVFEYGNGQFTTPAAPWEDEIDNEVEL